MGLRIRVLSRTADSRATSFSFQVETLDDSDPSVRYDAMFTLCMAMKAPDLPCPSVPLFQSNESLYLDRVRDLTNGRIIPLRNDSTDLGKAAI
jgi:hypothetical protein